MILFHQMVDTRCVCIGKLIIITTIGRALQLSSIYNSKLDNYIAKYFV